MSRPFLYPGSAEAGPSRHSGAADAYQLLATQAPADSQASKRRRVDPDSLDLDEELWDKTGLERSGSASQNGDTASGVPSSVPASKASGSGGTSNGTSNGSNGVGSRAPSASVPFTQGSSSGKKSSAVGLDAIKLKSIDDVLRSKSIDDVLRSSPLKSSGVSTSMNGSGMLPPPTPNNFNGTRGMDLDESCEPSPSSSERSRPGMVNVQVEMPMPPPRTQPNGARSIAAAAAEVIVIEDQEDDLWDNPLQLAKHVRNVYKGVKDVDAHLLIEPSRGTGYVYDTDMMLHFDIVEEHPECPERISRIVNVLKASNCLARMKRIKVREATKAEVMLVHSEAVWRDCEAIADLTDDVLYSMTQFVGVRDSLYFNSSSSLCARIACGSVLELCDAVGRGDIRNGFAVVRPPGHHAESQKSMGFCFYNNVAVAARWLQQRFKEDRGNVKAVKKILIVDWDVHHGNGTQDIFYDDPSIMYVSVHRYENGTFYPCSTAGSARCTGGPNAPGTNINVAWERGEMGDGDYMHAFQQVILPIAHEFAPDFVLISAGFDAAAGDALGGNLVSTKGYAHMTQMLDGLANGRLVVALEGGYNIDAIANSALAVTRVILGDPAPAYAEGALACSIDAAETVRELATYHSAFWKCLPQSALDPITYDLEANRWDDPDGESALKAIPLPDLLCDHRQRLMQQRHDFSVFNVEDLPAFDGLALVGPSDFCFREPPYETIVFFVHELGNLRVERTLLQADAHVELGYVLDSSFGLVDWARRPECDFGVLDVSLLGKFKVPKRETMNGRIKTNIFGPDITPEARAVQLEDYVFFLWDNLIGLSEAKNIVLIGQGSGCDAVMKIIAERANIATRVKAVVMAMSHGRIPILPADNLPLKKWYNKHSKVILPHDHPYYTLEEQVASGKRLGKVERSSENHSIRVLSTALPSIKTFVENKLGLPKVGNTAEVPKVVAEAAVDPSIVTATPSTALARLCA